MRARRWKLYHKIMYLEAYRTLNGEEEDLEAEDDSSLRGEEDYWAYYDELQAEGVNAQLDKMVKKVAKDRPLMQKVGLKKGFNGQELMNAMWKICEESWQMYEKYKRDDDNLHDFCREIDREQTHYIRRIQYMKQAFGYGQLKTDATKLTHAQRLEIRRSQQKIWKHKKECRQMVKRIDKLRLGQRTIDGVQLSEVQNAV